MSDDSLSTYRAKRSPDRTGEPFSGIAIPGGRIGWDGGEWVPLDDWGDGLEKGKLLFELRGYKVHGKWTLAKIKMAGAEKE
jgi:hypothetical protein